MKTKLLILMLALILSGCSFLSPVQIQPENNYLLTATHIALPRHAARPITLLVVQPETEALYNTTQMVYTTRPYQIAYFAQNRWAETPSQMLHSLIVQTLQNAHYFRRVVSPPYAGRYDYVLSTRILTLQQNFLYHPSIVQLTVRADLIKAGNNQIIATKLFTITVPMQQRTPYSGVVAANHATVKLLSELALFSFKNTR